MNLKFPSKELEMKKKERWISEDKDPWRGVTDLLARIDPVSKVPDDYNFSALHDKVMDAINDKEPEWLLKSSRKKQS